MAENNAVVGWQTSPSRRGTLTIIENSLFTILACTWSIQHLNVPRLDDTWRETLPRKCIWVVFTVFFPEFLMGHAILEFFLAANAMAMLEKKGQLKNDHPWWFHHLRRAPKNSGDEESAFGGPPEATSGRQETKWSLTHCYFANMGGFYLREEAASPSEAKIHLLTALHFADSWDSVQIPELSKDDLNDKSKMDYFTKAIAVIQIAQLLLSLIFRAVRHLAFSQLETLTLAFAICGVLTYICYWYKPQDVRRPIRVELRPGKRLPPNFQQRTFDRLWEVLIDSKNEGDGQPLDRIRNDNIPKSEQQTIHYALYLLTALTAGFGSIHAIAWNFEFPTLTEQILWRTATLVSTAVPPLALLAIPLSQRTISWGDSRGFMRDCLRVMREYSWHAIDKKPVRAAIGVLEEGYNNIKDGKTDYSEIFRKETTDGSSEVLGRRLISFINKNGALQDSKSQDLPEDFGLPEDFKLPKVFVNQFSQLVDILDGKLESKGLRDKARTNEYPQRLLFTKQINLAIIYATGIMYCLARLSIIGVAFSSLRRMPNSVYATTWTRNIPSVQ